MKTEMQRKISSAHKAGKTVRHGPYEYCIAYNACCAIHTWIIRRKTGGEWHWLMPLDKDVY